MQIEDNEKLMRGISTEVAVDVKRPREIACPFCAQQVRTAKKSSCSRFPKLLAQSGLAL